MASAASSEKMAADVEMRVTHQENDRKPANGFACNFESLKTPEEIKAEKRFVRKIDFMILPLLAISLFLASLDRGDTGYAYTAGMGKELRLTAQQLSSCVSLFYVGYIITELPATLFLKRITANIQLTLALFSWGMFTTLLCTTHSWQAVAGLRVLVGCAESFLQAAGLYLTFFYKRNELASRGSIYYAMFAVAGSVNGLMAYGILKNLNGVGGWLAWRWIFLIEGLMSVGFGFFIFLLLPSSPEKLRWGWSTAEKEIALRRYREAFNVENDTRVRGAQILGVLKDPKSWFYILIYACTNVSLAAFGNFLPVLVKNFGFSTLDANLLTIPIWVFAAIFIVAIGFVSDRLQKRGWLLMACFAFASVGYIILLARPSTWVRFVATLFIGGGTYPQVVLLQSWLNSNMLGYTKSDPPYYYRGNGFALGFMVVGFILTGTFISFLHKKNVAKVAAQGSAEAAARRSMTVEEIQDAHPDFMYFL